MLPTTNIGFASSDMGNSCRCAKQVYAHSPTLTGVAFVPPCTPCKVIDPFDSCGKSSSLDGGGTTASSLSALQKRGSEASEHVGRVVARREHRGWIRRRTDTAATRNHAGEVQRLGSRLSPLFALVKGKTDGISVAITSVQDSRRGAQREQPDASIRKTLCEATQRGDTDTTTVSISVTEEEYNDDDHEKDPDLDDDNCVRMSQLDARYTTEQCASKQLTSGIIENESSEPSTPIVLQIDEQPIDAAQLLFCTEIEPRSDSASNVLHCINSSDDVGRNIVTDSGSLAISFKPPFVECLGDNALEVKHQLVNKQVAMVEKQTNTVEDYSEQSSKIHSLDMVYGCSMRPVSSDSQTFSKKMASTSVSNETLIDSLEGPTVMMLPKFPVRPFDENVYKTKKMAVPVGILRRRPPYIAEQGGKKKNKVLKKRSRSRQNTGFMLPATLPLTRARAPSVCRNRSDTTHVRKRRDTSLPSRRNRLNNIEVQHTTHLGEGKRGNKTRNIEVPLIPLARKCRPRAHELLRDGETTPNTSALTRASETFAACTEKTTFFDVFANGVSLASDTVSSSSFATPTEDILPPSAQQVLRERQSSTVPQASELQEIFCGSPSSSRDRPHETSTVSRHQSSLLSSRYDVQRLPASSYDYCNNTQQCASRIKLPKIGIDLKRLCSFEFDSVNCVERPRTDRPRLRRIDLPPASIATARMPRDRDIRETKMDSAFMRSCRATTERPSRQSPKKVLNPYSPCPTRSQHLPHYSRPSLSDHLTAYSTSQRSD